MVDGTKAVIVGPNEGATIEGPVGGPLTFKVRGEQTNGALTAFENVIPPGQGPPLHTHANEDESWYVIEGELRFKLAGDVHRAPAGAFVFVPRGTPHCFQNVADAPARILVTFTPAGMEHFFDRFADLPTPDPDAFENIGGPFGMEILGPPLAQSDGVAKRPDSAPPLCAKGVCRAISGRTARSKAGLLGARAGGFCAPGAASAARPAGTGAPRAVRQRGAAVAHVMLPAGSCWVDRSAECSIVRPRCREEGWTGDCGR